MNTATALPGSLRLSQSVLIAAALATLYLLWGSTYLAVRWAEIGLPPLGMAGMRHLGAGLVLLGGMAWRGGLVWPTARQWRDTAAIGVLLLTIGNGGVVLAETRIPSGVTAVVIATVPLWMMAMGWLAGRRPSRLASIGLVVGFLGTMLLMMPSGGGSLDGVGLLTALLGAVGWAAGSVFAKSADLPAQPLLSTAMSMVAGGVSLLLASGLTGEHLHVHGVPAVSWLALLYLLVFGSLVGFSCYNWLLRVAPAEKVATYAYVNPVVALTLGTALGGEALSARTVLAALVVLASVGLIVSRRPA